MKTLYLHVGLHKTATTSIQNTLLHNRDLFIKNGFFVPVIKVKERVVSNHTILFRNLFGDNPKNFHANIKMGLLDELDQINESFLEQLESLVDVPQETIIISGEGISNISDNGLTKLRSFFEQRGFQIKVICALRGALSSATSRIQQRVKGGYPALTNISKFSSSKDLIINRLKAVKKGFSDVCFYSFEESLEHSFGPVGYFLELIGVPDRMFPDITFYRVNESISDVSVRIIDYINSMHPYLIKGQINPNRNEDDIRPLLELPGPKFYLRQDEINKIIDKVKLENAFYSELTGYDFSRDAMRAKTVDNHIDQNTLCEQLFLLPNPLRDYAYEYAVSNHFIDESVSLSPIKKLSLLVKYQFKKLLNI